MAQAHRLQGRAINQPCHRQPPGSIPNCLRIAPRADEDARLSDAHGKCSHKLLAGS